MTLAVPTAAHADPVGYLELVTVDLSNGTHIIYDQGGANPPVGCNGDPGTGFAVTSAFQATTAEHTLTGYKVVYYEELDCEGDVTGEVYAGIPGGVVGVFGGRTRSYAIEPV